MQKTLWIGLIHFLCGCVYVCVCSFYQAVCKPHSPVVSLLSFSHVQVTGFNITSFFCSSLYIGESCTRAYSGLYTLTYTHTHTHTLTELLLKWLCDMSQPIHNDIIVCVCVCVWVCVCVTAFGYCGNQKLSLNIFICAHLRSSLLVTASSVLDLCVTANSLFVASPLSQFLGGDGYLVSYCCCGC